MILCLSKATLSRCGLLSAQARIQCKVTTFFGDFDYPPQRLHVCYSMIEVVDVSLGG